MRRRDLAIARCSVSNLVNGRAAYARSAIHGVCSKMPPSAATKSSRVAAESHVDSTVNVHPFGAGIWPMRGDAVMA